MATKITKALMVNFVLDCCIGTAAHKTPKYQAEHKKLMGWRKSTLTRFYHSYLHGNGKENAGCCGLNPIQRVSNG